MRPSNRGTAAMFYHYRVREQEIAVPLTITSLSQTSVRKLSLPRFQSRADHKLALSCWRTAFPAISPTPLACFPFRRTEERIPSVNSPVKARPPGLTSAFTIFARARRPSACPPHSTVSRFTARTRTSDPTSTERSARAELASVRWMTPRNACMRVSIFAIPTRRYR